MRTSVLVFVLLGSGCAQMGWYKDGSTQQEFDRDSYTCTREAMTAAPPAYVNTQPQNQGAIYTNCNQYSRTVNCVTTQAPAPIAIPYDINAISRARIHSACMNSKGWTWHIRSPK